MIIIVSVVLSFLYGSIPTGYLIVKKLYGIDIRTKGSGNIGSTNVKRVAGSKISIITQAVDILKGFIPVLLGCLLYKELDLSVSKDAYISIIALASILGHDYTPFLSFNGGKGVNTTIGAFLPIAVIPVITGVLMYFALRLFTSIVSIRSIALGISLSLMCFIIGLPLEVSISAVFASALMIYRHKENINRIINKQEK